MSISTIKSELEEYLKTNLLNVAVKWNNTNYYTKNNAPLGSAEIDALTIFIEPRVIPISSDRELMSSAKPFQSEIFFQIDIYNKVNTGTGLVYSIVEDLDALFREQFVNDVVCDRTNTIGSFVSGEWEITPHRIHATLWS